MRRLSDQERWIWHGKGGLALPDTCKVARSSCGKSEANACCLLQIDSWVAERLAGHVSCIATSTHAAAV